MSRDFAKKRYSEQQSLKQRRRRLLFVFIFLLLISGIGVSVYRYKNQFTSLAQWFFERKNHLQQGVTKVKQLAEKKETLPEEIHFEFYTALPSMRVKPSSPPVENNKIAASKTVAKASAPVKAPLFDPAEIEEDVSSKLKSRENRE